MSTGVALSFIVPILFSLCLMVGVAIAARGIIGLPVWRSPRCASCGHGIAPRPESLRSACPECGADLSRPSGIHYFARQRRYGRVVAGLAVTASSLGLVAIIRFLLWLSMPASIGPSTPIATLAVQIKENAGYEPLAISEAANRLVSGTLTNADLTTLIEAMRTPAASEHNRYPKLGELDLLLEAHRRQLIDEDDLVEFGRAYTETPSLRIPDTFRPPFVLGVPSFATQQMNAFSRSIDVLKLEVDGVDVPIVDYQGERLERVQWGRYGQVSIDGAPGRHTLRVTYEENFVFGPDRAASPLTPIKLVASRVVETPLTYVPADAPSWLAMASPPDRRAEVEAACIVRAVALDRDASGERYTLRAKFWLNPVQDLGFAFDIVVRLGSADSPSQEFTVGSMAALSWGSSTTTVGPNESMVTLSVLPHSLSPTATVIFRPNPAHAEAIAGAKEVWGEEVVIRDVPIRTTIEGPPSAPADAVDSAGVAQ